MLSHTRMGVPYEYTHMGRSIRVYGPIYAYGPEQAHGRRQLGSICSHWLCDPLMCYWPPCGRHGCSWGVPGGGFFRLPPHPTPSHPAPPPPPIPPTSFIINTDGRKGRQKYLEIQPSETEKANYNKTNR